MNRFVGGEGPFEFEPHQGSGFRPDAPAVGELLDQVETPVRVERCVGSSGCGLETRPFVANLDAQEAIRQSDLEVHAPGRAGAGVLDAVGDQLGRQQRRDLDLGWVELRQ